jgi:hypothetical protein
MGLELGKPVLPLPAVRRWKLRDLPSSQSTPMCICPALRPRPGHAHQANKVIWCCPRCSDDEGPSDNHCFEAQSRSFCTRCLRFVPPLLTTTQDSLPAGG